MTPKKIVTIENILANSSLPRLETEMLLGFVLNKSREYILTHPELTISSQDALNFRKLEQKRHNNWPLAYLIKRQGFYGLDLNVSPAVLIPRPETELIIDIFKDGLEKLPTNAKPLIVDVGTGSGAIIITLAQELKRLSKIFTKTLFIGIDISLSALKIAKLNTSEQKLGQKIKFIKSNLLDRIPATRFRGHDLFIAANLPYLTLKQIKDQPSIAREPKLALVGGRDGLSHYRQLFKQLNSLPLRSLFLVCEIDPTQTTKIKKLAKTLIAQSTSEIKKDLRKKNRFIIIKKAA